jgi:uncharacterized Zn-finger protein
MEVLITKENICFCGTKFKTKKYLSEHQKYVHSYLKKFYCAPCQKSYKYKRGLVRHLKTSHNVN